MSSTRREFIGATAGLALGAFIARQGFAQSPNDRIGIGLIGCGKRGTELLKECLAAREKWNIEFPIICDVWRTALTPAAALIKDAAGAEPKTCTRYQDVLAHPDVDAVIIATPDFQHAKIMTDAAAAKKHIFVEAPMGTKVRETGQAMDAVKASNVVCQVGVQRRSDPQYMGAAKLMTENAINPLVRVELYSAKGTTPWREPWRDIKMGDVDWDGFMMGCMKECFFDPNMLRNWQNFRECSSGLPGIMGCHLADLVSWYTGQPYPEAAVGSGVNSIFQDMYHYETVEYVYYYKEPRPFLVQCSLSIAQGAHRPEAKFMGFRGAFDTDAWAMTTDGVPSKRGPQKPTKIEPIPGPTHLQNWIECVRKNDLNTHAPVEVGYQHTVAACLAISAMNSGLRMNYYDSERAIRQGERPRSPYDTTKPGALY